MQRSGPTWVSGVLALVLLGACQGSGEPSGDPTSAPTASSDAVATSTAPTEDAEPTTAAPSFEEDQAGAAQIVEEFHATLDGRPRILRCPYRTSPAWPIARRYCSGYPIFKTDVIDNLYKQETRG